jgi:hypothetical protein
MSDYRLFLAMGVFEYLVQLRGAARQRIQEELEHIRQRPADCSDFSEVDAQGRLIHTHVCGKHAARYWEDFADRHVKILEIVPADLGT